MIKNLVVVVVIVVIVVVVVVVLLHRASYEVVNVEYRVRLLHLLLLLLSVNLS